MAQKVVTLYLDDTSIRLMVAHERRIKKWADLPLEPGLVKNGVVLKEAEVAAKIRQLLKLRKVKTKKVVVGISGLHCLTRPIILPQLPKEMLEEAVRREAKRVLPVALEQLYLSWQAIPAPEQKTQVFLVAVPCKTADALMRTLRQAGLKTELMDLKPLLLARLAPEATAIMVDVQATEFDIVIMADKVPQPIRTIALPNQALPWEEKLLMIKNDLARTIQFYNANNPERPLADTVPIFVSGELASKPELGQSLSRELGHPVLPLPSPLECPEDMNPNLYLANISLVLKKLHPAGEAALSIGSLNLLPASYRPEPISLTRVLALPGVVVALGLLFFLAVLIQNTSAEIASLRRQLETADQLLQQKIELKQSLSQRIAELEKKIAQAQTSGDSLAAAVATLEKQQHAVNGDLKAAVGSLSSAIAPSSIIQANPTLTIKGSALSGEDILAYLKELEASGQFSHITIASMKRVAEERMDFVLILSPRGE